MNEENLEVEEKQAKQFDQVVGQYFFEVEVAGLKSGRSPILEALKPGIDLHFYRYGLFPESAKSTGNDQALLSFNKDGEKVKQPEELKPGGPLRLMDFSMEELFSIRVICMFLMLTMKIYGMNMKLMDLVDTSPFYGRKIRKTENIRMSGKLMEML